MPRAKKSPAYQWYPRDYMSDALVVSMTLEQEGAYRRLMDVCWLERGLPTDLNELWRLAKAPSRDAFTRRIWPVVGRKFQPRKGRLQHKRLDRERAKQAKTRKARQLAARDRWDRQQCKQDANASDLQCLTSSSSTSTAVGTEKSTGAARRTLRSVENTDGTYALYCVIAKEARTKSLQDDGTESIANVAAIFKQLCADRHLTYDGDEAARAIEAACRPKAS